MQELLLMLAEPVILWTLFASSILLVLLDYLLPVDWLAYVGYLCFSLFVAATIPTTPGLSFAAMIVVAATMLVAHQYFFSRYLTNAPRYERCSTPDEYSSGHNSSVKQN